MNIVQIGTKKPFVAYGYTTDNIDIINNLTLYKNSYQKSLLRFDLISNLKNNSSKNSSGDNDDDNYDDSEYKNISIIPLKVVKENCFAEEICKGYIMKNNTDFKMVILKIPEGSKNLEYEGGGHFDRSPGGWGLHTKYKKSTEKRTVETWRRELE